MTVQLELDFFSTYAYTAVLDLVFFATSGSPFKNICSFSFSRYKELQRQAIDLNNYAFLYGYIDCKEHDYLFDGILEASNLFWGV